MHSYLNKSYTDQLLGKVRPATEGSGYQVEQVSLGTGEISLYQLMMQNQTNAILQIAFTQAKYTTDKAALAESLTAAPGTIAQSLLATLTEQYELHPWKGENTFLPRPYQVSSETLEKRDEIVIASAKAVRDAFPRQGLAADDYSVIDYPKFYSMLQKIAKDRPLTEEQLEELDLSISGKIQLNLTKFSLSKEQNLEYFLSLYKSHGIESIKVTAPSIVEILLIKHYFPDIEIDVLNATEEWLKRCETWESARGEKLFANQSLVLSRYQSTTLNAKISAKKLIISHAENLVTTSITSTDQDLESFIMLENQALGKSKGNNNEIAILNAPKLKHFDASKLVSLLGRPPHNITMPDSTSVETVLLPASLSLQETKSEKPISSTDSKISVTTCKLDEFYKLEHLKELKIYRYYPKKLTAPKSLEELELEAPFYLEQLDLEACSHLRKLTIKSRCASFTQIDLSSSTNLEELNLEFPNLTTANLLVCQKIVSLTINETNKLPPVDLSQFKKLKYLSLHLKNYANWKPHHCTELETLTLISSDFEDYKNDAINLSQLKSLQILSLDKVKNFKNWNIQNCSRLKTLKLKNVELDSKENIDLGKAENVTIEWNFFSNYTTTALTFEDANFKNITIEGNKNLTNTTIKNAKNLETLTIKDCQTLTNLNLTDCPALKSLNISNCNLEKFHLTPLESLEELTIENCASLTNINFSHLPNLKRLKIQDCTGLNLSKFDFDKLSKIEDIYLKKIPCGTSPAVEYINFEKCQKLKSITLDSIKNLRGVLLPSEVEKIHYNDCPSLICDYNQNIKEIQVNNISILSMADLNCPKLYKLTVSNLFFIYLECAKLPCLQTLDIRCTTKPEIINLDKCTQLRSAHFETPINTAISLLLPKECTAPIFTKPGEKTTPTPLTVFREGESKETSPDHEVKRAAGLDKSVAEQLQAISDDPTVIASLKSHNDASTVGCFSLSDERDDGIDAPTGIPRVIQAKGNIKITVTKKQDADPRLYRWKIFDEMIVTNTTISFDTAPEKKGDVTPVISTTWPTFDVEHYDLLEEMVKTSVGNLALGHFNGKMEKGVRYPLSADQIIDSRPNLCCNPAVALTLSWDQAKQQYYVELADTKDTPSPPEVFVNILYLFNTKPDYFVFPTSHTHELVTDPNLSEAIPLSVQEKIKEKITEEIIRTKNDNHLLNFLVDPKYQNIALQDKIARLKLYCENFDDKKKLIETEKKPTKIDTLASIIAQGAGNCVHRSKAYMVIARMLGVQARMLRGSQHRFAETLFQSKKDGNLEWRGSDLGGGDAIDLTEKNKREHIKEYIHKVEIKSVAPSPRRTGTFKTAKDEKTLAAEFKEKKDLEKLIEDTYESLTKKSIIESATDLPKLNPKLPPLIYLSPEQTSYQVNKAIINHLGKTPGKDYLYIHSAKDFEQYLKPCIIKDGKRTILELHESPLYNIINNGGTLVINWSNFSIKQIGTYKSILDTQPKLHEHELKGKPKIYGLTNRKTQNYQAFASRCQPYSLAPSFLTAAEPKEAEIKEEKLETQSAESIYLFQRPNWYPHIYGTPLPGKQQILIEGPLIKAIRENKPLTITIYDPPDSDEFRTLLHRIEDERVILYNGEWLPIHPGFKIKIANLEPILTPSTIEFVKDKKEEKSDTRQLQHVSLNDLHRLYKEILPDENDTPIVGPGLLEKHDPTKQIFYITQSIPPNEWQAFLHYISTHEILKTQPFTFKLAPGVEIIGTDFKGPNVSPPQVVTASAALSDIAPLILSNDPDFTCSQLENKFKESKLETRVVHIKASDSFASLIAGQMPVLDEKDPQNVQLHFKKSHYLQDLIDGKNVIFTGAISPALYRQLLPLLSGKQSYVDYKGVRTPINGKLTLIVPHTLSEEIKPVDAKICQYELKDYLAAFPEKKDQKLIEDIHFFISQVRLLPEKGLGIPKRPTLSYEHIKTMLNIMREHIKTVHNILGTPGPHPHNPIKPALLYKYPDASNHYAYVNVIGKMIFHPTDPSPVRVEKLKRLNKQALTEENIWKFLNCFNGQQLMDIFKGQIKSSIILKSEFPTVTPAIFDKVRNMVKSICASPEEKAAPKKRTNYEKGIAELNKKMADKNCQIISLVGFAGVKKTETIKRLEKNKKIILYKSDAKDALINWLKDKRKDKPKVFFCDELNTSLPDTSNFLKEVRRGLEQGQPRVFILDDVHYQLDEQHKIITTGNPVRYAGRYHHELMDVYSHTIYLKTPTDAEIIAMLNEEMSTRLPDQVHEVFLSAFHLAREINPVYTYSIRDLVGAAKRLVLSKPTVENTLFACINEFSGTFFETNQHEEFVNKLSRKFKLQLEEKKSTTGVVALPKPYDDKKMLYFPSSKAHIIKAIQQDLELRFLDIEKPIGEFKKIILLEGNPGVGKSTLYEAILRQQGFRKKDEIPPPEPKKKYYFITQGDAGEAVKIITEAFHEGAVVILDELNLDEDAERLINRIVNQGEDLVGKKAKQRGVAILSSQNPSNTEGMSATSPSLLNRCHVIQMIDNTNAELAAVAKHNRFPDPEMLVGYQKKYEGMHPEVTNMRTFTTVMENVMNTLDARKASVASQRATVASAQGSAVAVESKTPAAPAKASIKMLGGKTQSDQ